MYKKGGLILAIGRKYTCYYKKGGKNVKNGGFYYKMGDFITKRGLIIRNDGYSMIV